MEATEVVAEAEAKEEEAEGVMEIDPIRVISKTSNSTKREEKEKAKAMKSRRRADRRRGRDLSRTRIATITSIIMLPDPRGKEWK